jgi:hypothetical protein
VFRKLNALALFSVPLLPLTQFPEVNGGHPPVAADDNEILIVHVNAGLAPVGGTAEVTGALPNEIVSSVEQFNPPVAGEPSVEFAEQFDCIKFRENCPRTSLGHYDLAQGIVERRLIGLCFNHGYEVRDNVSPTAAGFR